MLQAAFVVYRLGVTVAKWAVPGKNVLFLRSFCLFGCAGLLGFVFLVSNTIRKHLILNYISLLRKY